MRNEAKKLLLALSSIQGIAHADDSLQKTCQSHAKNLRSADQEAWLKEGCLDSLSQVAPANARAHSVSWAMSAFGAGGLLLLRQDASAAAQLVIGGSETGLQDIQAVAIHEKGRELIVLDRQAKAVLSFGAEGSGNLAPRRFFRKADFEHALDIAIDDDRSELHVLLDSPLRIQTYNLYASEMGAKAENSLELKYEFKWPSESGPRSLTVDGEKHRLFMLLRDGIEVVDSQTGKITAHLRTSSIQPLAIRFVAGALQISNQDGSRDTLVP